MAAQKNDDIECKRRSVYGMRERVRRREHPRIIQLQKRSMTKNEKESSLRSIRQRIQFVSLFARRRSTFRCHPTCNSFNLAHTAQSHSHTKNVLFLHLFPRPVAPFSPHLCVVGCAASETMSRVVEINKCMCGRHDEREKCRAGISSLHANYYAIT